MQLALRAANLRHPLFLRKVVAFVVAVEAIEIHAKDENFGDVFVRLKVGEDDTAAGKRPLRVPHALSGTAHAVWVKPRF